MAAKSKEPRVPANVVDKTASAAPTRGERTREERTREELLSDHAAARHRRDAAGLESDAFREAALEVERIEVAIARLERSMEPPRM
jgi:hypothetical protein